MSKKKTNLKKHKFKHADPASASQPSHETGGQVSKPAAAVSGSSIASGRDFSYVTSDVRRIGMMVGGLILVELAFYYALGFTPIGPAIYRLVNV